MKAKVLVLIKLLLMTISGQALSDASASTVESSELQSQIISRNHATREPLTTAYWVEVEVRKPFEGSVSCAFLGPEGNRIDVLPVELEGASPGGHLTGKAVIYTSFEVANAQCWEHR